MKLNNMLNKYEIVCKRKFVTIITYFRLPFFIFVIVFYFRWGYNGFIIRTERSGTEA